MHGGKTLIVPWKVERFMKRSILFCLLVFLATFTCSCAIPTERPQTTDTQDATTSPKALVDGAHFTNIENAESPTPVKIQNNGNSVIRFGTEIFYLADYLSYENYRGKGALYRIAENGELEIIADISGGEIWSNGISLFISSSPDGTIVQIDPNTGKVTEISDGHIIYLSSDNTLYYSGYSSNGIYKMHLDTFDEVTIIDENTGVHPTAYFLSVIKVINDVLYYYETSGNTITVFSYDMASENLSVLTTETATAELLGDRKGLYIPRMSVCGDWLIYCIGTFQGSGNFFIGDYYRIKPDGTEKALMKINNRDSHNIESYDFQTLDGWIYYLHSPVEYTVDHGYYRIDPDVCIKEKLNPDIDTIIGAHGGFLYYKTAAGDIHRCNSDMDMDSVVVKAKDLYNHISEQDHYEYEINILEDRLYFDASVWGYREGFSWRNQFIDSTFNVIGIDGTGLQTLAIVSSELTGVENPDGQQ